MSDTMVKTSLSRMLFDIAEGIGPIADHEYISAMADRAENLEEQVRVLMDGIERFQSGDYPNPRSNRPDPCKHGRQCWEECEQCNDEWLDHVLAVSRGDMTDFHDKS